MATGQVSTYNLPTGTKLSVENIIYVIDPVDVPLQGTYNGSTNLPPTAGNNSIISQDDDINEKLYQWQEENLLTPRTTLAATYATADLFLLVASGQQSRFGTGDVIRIDAEVVRVTGYGSTADTLLAARAYGGTTAAQHSNTANVVGIGKALREGADSEAARFRDRIMQTNLTQIFGPERIEITESEQAIVMKGGKFGITDEFGHQVTNRTREMIVGFEQAILYGVRFEDTSNNWRTMGGAAFFLTLNSGQIDSTTTQVSYSAYVALAQGSYNNGGKIDTIVVGPTQKTKMSSFDSASIRLARPETIRGQVVDRIISDYGEADIVLDRWVLPSDLFGFDRQWLSIPTLRPLHFEVIAKTGDAMKGHVVGEKGFRLRMAPRHLRMTALT